MSGIQRPIVLDAKHIAKHLPDTPQMQRLLKKGRSAHVFNDEATMHRVARCIIENGEFTGTIRKYDRYGMFFSQPIGDRIDPDGSRIPLYYGEIKINENDEYHVIPRTRPGEK